MTAQDSPITELFGCQPGYPLNQNVCPPGQGFHNGIDYGCPEGTPIVVNGVTIGLSGATGYVTGPHLHVGRWVNGVPTDPGVGGGFSFNDAVVTQVGYDATNGNFVRVQADGASWVYLHMSQTIATVNQVLIKEGDNIVADIKIVGSPASVSWGKGRIDVFAQGSDNGLWHKWFSERGWSGWVREADTASPPSVSSWEKERLDVFFTGVSGDLVHLWYDGKWNGPESLDKPKE